MHHIEWPNTETMPHHSLHKCPECGRETNWHQNRFRPFCSARCKQIDLGKWLNEEYCLPVLESDMESYVETAQGISNKRDDLDSLH